MMDSDKKNIILVIVDAFRPKNLSIFGYEKETDKNLKKILKDSILFRKSFATSNSTAPSLNSIFTGMYPDNHGIWHQFPYTTAQELVKFSDNKFWFPKYLQEKGYNTIGIDWLGTWFKEGFNYYEEKEEKQSKMKKFMNIPFVKKILLNLPNWAYKLGKKMIKTRASAPFASAEDTTNLAISKIKESKKPFFLFMHLWDTHFPFPNTEYKAKEKDNDIDSIINNLKEDNQKEYIKKRVTDINLNSTKDIINKYDLTIENIDKQLGKIYKFLKDENLWEDTIFIMLGDHGDSLTEHEIYFEHSGLYDESIHVPMIIHLPGIESKEINELVQSVDIIPTILEFLGDPLPKDIDGKSMIKLIKNGESIRNAVFSIDGLSKNIKSVRTKNRKLIIADDNFCHLCKAKHHKNKEEYDLEKDPEEKNNIYSEKSILEKYWNKQNL